MDNNTLVSMKTAGGAEIIVAFVSEREFHVFWNGGVFRNGDDVRKFTNLTLALREASAEFQALVDDFGAED